MNQPDSDMNNFVADTGKPLLLPDNNRNIWFGDNLDPATCLVVGLGLIINKNDYI